MRRRIALVVAVSILAGGVGAIVHPWAMDRSVYKVAEVRDGLMHQPRSWIGRTVLVQGNLTSFVSLCVPTPATTCIVRNWIGFEIVPSSGIGWAFFMSKHAAGIPQAESGLVVQLAATDVTARTPTLPALLYRVPLLGALLPRWEGGTTYRVHLIRPQPCSAVLCPQGLLQ